ncbi:glycosyltransferase involved in cell wall biosynthesis [Desulfobaculum xiamenense]|uniref:Glycosyltransferase involved in cell wall biosynthesis n=1 Tax=Desulfobaculum xiamenense TaxID=995050 RepID=A0A846QRB6_9BACT|nr:glycosyltransferase [Desulfobaculum xiamenense]NJB67734.1 glycosyltransferase involved in cell wall biosynthesis [Desulfobaculum xiamenense]
MNIALILHETPARRLGGVELYVLSLARQLTDAGHEVTCWYPRPEGGALGAVERSVVDGVPFHGVAVPVRRDVASRFRDDEVGAALVSLLRERGTQVAHFHHLIGFTGSALDLSVRAGIASLFTAHDAWAYCNQCHLVRHNGHVCTEVPVDAATCARCLLGRVPGLARIAPLAVMTRLMDLRSRYLSAVIGRADVVLAASEYTRGHLTGAGVPAERVRLFPLGVSVDGVETVRARRTGRRGPLRVGYLGRLTFKKGLDVLVEAFSRLAPGAATLDVHGHAEQGAYCEPILRRMMGLPGATYRGNYGPPDLAGILARLDVVVVPSREESYCLVAREAFAAGVPLVASRLPALADVLDDGVNALVVAPGDAGELADALSRLAADEALCASLSANVPSVRTVGDDARDVVDMYRTILSEPDRM